MVHEELLDRQYRVPFGGGETRLSGPTIVKPLAPDVFLPGEVKSAAAREELSSAAPALAIGERPSLPPWQAAARAKGRPGYFLAKRCLDCSIALIALMVFAPVFLAAALLIRLTSRGPVIFRQKRVGFRGRHFVMYKFRSMYVNCDERLHQRAYEKFLRGERSHGKVGGVPMADGERHADEPPAEPAPAAATGKRRRADAPRDPRVTPFGHVLRSSSIDELPQLFNVLRGDMSLVGPRPPIPYEVNLYNSWHAGRLDTLPGLTGIWQVHGRSRVSFEEMVRMDLEYIQKQSFWYDLKLLALTIPAVLSRKGAE